MTSNATMAAFDERSRRVRVYSPRTEPIPRFCDEGSDVMDNRVRVLGVGVGLTAVLLFGGASAVQADPSGCTGKTPTLSFNSSNYMTATGTATCSTSSTRTWRVEIKYQKTLSPDPLVGGSSYTYTGKSYSRSYATCDDGAAHPYYARSFFTTNTSYHDSATQDHRSC